MGLVERWDGGVSRGPHGEDQSESALAFAFAQRATGRFEPLIGGLIISILAVQLLNVVGIGRSFGAYLLGLILLLSLASIHFVALLVAVQHSDTRDRD